MWQSVGVLRDEAGLRRAVAQFRRWMTEVTDGSELYDQLLVSRLVAESAMARRESRGAHFRTDFRQPNRILTRRHVITPPSVATESVAVDQSRIRGLVTA
jgi:L-aspartate oxidase